ncbi:MAG: response regulator [Planctomycetes bacterium]|nr:response regulator [Planctomycetota bacterium]
MDNALVVLVIEDNLGDFHLLEESFAEQSVPAKLFLVPNAVQAFSFLSRQGQFAGMPKPDLVLLDLNLPIIRGHKVLDIIRSTEEWARLPVIVLSSSTLKKDREECARFQVEAHLVKPSHYDGYLELAKEIAVCCKRIASMRERRRTASMAKSVP